VNPSSTESTSPLTAAQTKMQSAGVHPVAITVFSHYYHQLAKGATGLIPEGSISPVSMPRLAEVEIDQGSARAALAGTVVVKLNGGLGTSMGMDQAKSLLPVKSGLSFLDITARQVLSLRKKYDVRLPLIMMNSFRTSADSLAALSRYPELGSPPLPQEFLQNKEPKLRASDLAPVEFPQDPDLEWCPPGHGDIYPALLSSRIIRQLLELGFERLFISNSDNLGAVADPQVAGWFAASGAPFALEAVLRTPSDRKSGHFARRVSDGRLVLREFSQCPPEDAEFLQDLGRHQHCNTNNIWIDLGALEAELTTRNGILGLPLIRNVKTVDPSDRSSTEVIQIETAMGAAIEVFADAQLIEVGRDRFVPVKTTNDLLVLRSDAYELAEDATLRLMSKTLPFVDLSGSYKLVPHFDQRFPFGAPSLVEAQSFHVTGDWTFGRDVVVKGDVTLGEGGGQVADGSVLVGP
jgi:UTP--glucose-1-phosphate uridylyltransferase